MEVDLHEWSKRSTLHYLILQHLSQNLLLASAREGIPVRIHKRSSKIWQTDGRSFGLRPTWDDYETRGRPLATPRLILPSLSFMKRLWNYSDLAKVSSVSASSWLCDWAYDKGTFGFYTPSIVKDSEKKGKGEGVPVTFPPKRIASQSKDTWLSFFS